MVHEIGVIDKQGNKHPVILNKGLNVITGKSSTGKSALLEIFDYCFGSSTNTVPKGVITDNATIYYVILLIGEQVVAIARDPMVNNKAFLRRVEVFNTDDINKDYFKVNYFRPLSEFKKHLRSFFLDIEDVDESLEVRKQKRYGRKSPTPSVRSFMSFILQHQNLVANKHALFYRFDEKEKRDQAIDHTKIFLGLVDQHYFHLSQEHERLSIDINQLERKKETNKRIINDYKKDIEPILSLLYALMGINEVPISSEAILCHPQDAKEQLEKLIVSNKINHDSDELFQRHSQLESEKKQQTTELRKLYRKAESINKSIKDDERLTANIVKLNTPEHAHISNVICPFCHTEKDSLNASAEKLVQAIKAISGSLAQVRPMTAQLESSLVEVKRDIKVYRDRILELDVQIKEIEDIHEQIVEHNNLQEKILEQKIKLFMTMDALGATDDIEFERHINSLKAELNVIKRSLEQYNVKEGLQEASKKVNRYMKEIGKNFEFEESYQPIDLHFSFETFDLYHLTPGKEKIFLRSMGSGANWLYSHVTLFLALHRYFTELGDKCSIPSILFLDQPTQVYFPNFNRDHSNTFDDQISEEREQRQWGQVDASIDEDIKAVENLFSQIAIYCSDLDKQYGFSPQIIVIDHADNLTLADGISFNSLVKNNRWRQRGFIDPMPII